MEAKVDELVRLREANWRLRSESSGLRDTIVELRSGANSLAAENAMLKVENEHLRRMCARRGASR
jgi:regulator of replication initiation timing